MVEAIWLNETNILDLEIYYTCMYEFIYCFYVTVNGKKKKNLYLHYKGGFLMLPTPFWAFY